MKRIPATVLWWIAAPTLCVVTVAVLYVWRFRRYALEVYPLQSSYAGGNVQGLFTYHATTIAVAALFVVYGAALAAVIQLWLIRRDRDAEMAIEILEHLEDPSLFRMRGFINKHINDINQNLTADTPRETVDEQVKRLSGENKWDLEDIFRVVNVLNHTCLFIRKDFISDEIALEFYPVITRMWTLLAPLIYWERRRRSEVDELKSHWYSDHFEKVARKMLSPEYTAKVRGRLDLPRVRFAPFATKPEVDQALNEIAALRSQLEELQSRVPKTPSQPKQSQG